MVNITNPELVLVGSHIFVLALIQSSSVALIPINAKSKHLLILNIRIHDGLPQPPTPTHIYARNPIHIHTTLTTQSNHNNRFESFVFRFLYQKYIPAQWRKYQNLKYFSLINRYSFLYQDASVLIHFFDVIGMIIYLLGVCYEWLHKLIGVCRRTYLIKIFNSKGYKPNISASEVFSGEC